MGVVEQIIQTLKKYANFSGRASRSEFWTFFFFVMAVQAAARMVDMLFGRGSLVGPLASLLGVLLIVPQLSVAIRRLHDVNRGGRELVMPLVMLAVIPLMMAFGSILGRIVALGFYAVALVSFAQILLLLTKKGGTVPNRYGASPTAFSFGG